MSRRVLIAVASAVLLSGCSLTTAPHGLLGKLWGVEVGPDYRRPAVEMPDEFRGQLGAAEAASFADLPWWEVFGDAALQRLVRQALVGNYNLQGAVANVEQARAQVGVAASSLFPQAGYEGAAAREKAFLIPDRPNSTFNVFLGAFNLAWEIDVWGRIRRSTEAARAQFLASEEARRGVVVTLVSDVATNYFRLLELDRELAIARDSADTYRHTLDVFTERYRGGTDTKISTARAQANLQASLATIASLQRQIVAQEDAISVLLGSNPAPVERGTPLIAQTTPETPSGLTTALLERRPDVRGAEQRMITANAEVGVAVANFFPVIGLSALYGGESARTQDLFKSSGNIWNIAADVSGPIFQGGKLIESYYAQKAFWDETIARYRGTIVRAFGEVADALAAQARLAEQRAAQEAQVAALREAVELVLLRYKIGLSNYIEVLDAEQLLYPAEDALAQTQRDQLLAVVNLYKALGGGWATQ
jgi:multidrug efflux system outer membrane protein